MKHSDNRRILVEFGNGKTWKVCKVIKAKEDCVLGEHYHKKKDESFMLVSGSGKIQVYSFHDIVTHFREKMELHKEYFVPKGMVHEFFLTKDSILIGLGSKKFNVKDDHE